MHSGHESTSLLTVALVFYKKKNYKNKMQSTKTKWKKKIEKKNGKRNKKYEKLKKSIHFIRCKHLYRVIHHPLLNCFYFSRALAMTHAVCPIYILYSKSNNNNKRKKKPESVKQGYSKCLRLIQKIKTPKNEQKKK